MDILDHPIHLDWLKTSGAGEGTGGGGAQCYVLELGCNRISVFYVCIYNFNNKIFQNINKLLIIIIIILLLILIIRQ